MIWLIASGFVDYRPQEGSSTLILFSISTARQQMSFFFTPCSRTVFIQTLESLDRFITRREAQVHLSEFPVKVGSLFFFFFGEIKCKKVHIADGLVVWFGFYCT